MNQRTKLVAGLFFLILSNNVSYSQSIKAIHDTTLRSTGNPLFSHKYTADPAALVYKDNVYLYTGHDVAPSKENRYVMHEWLCYSTSDMVNWTEHLSPLNVNAFKWAKDDAWASQVIERNGKFYWG